MNRHTIPEHWSPEQALAVYEFLQALADQLWQRYHLDLAAWLGEPAADVLKPDRLAAQQIDLFDDSDADELPF